MPASRKWWPSAEKMDEWAKDTTKYSIITAKEYLYAPHLLYNPAEQTPPPPTKTETIIPPAPLTLIHEDEEGSMLEYFCGFNGVKPSPPKSNEPPPEPEISLSITNQPTDIQWSKTNRPAYYGLTKLYDINDPKAPFFPKEYEIIKSDTLHVRCILFVRFN